jgi:molybdopterin converting factor small subunit
MRVCLKLIATYRKLLPEGVQGNVLEIDLAEGTCVEEVLQRFGVPIDRTSVILVNGHTLEDHQRLKEGDTIYAFPALAGG